MNELRDMSELELLRTSAEPIAELRRRGVVKTRNNPIADYTEWLVCNRLKLQVQRNSKAGIDAVDPQDVRYQIKGRQSAAQSVQFGIIRDLDNLFDYLIAVAFNEDYSVRFATKVLYRAVLKVARPNSYQNGHILTLTEKMLKEEGFKDIGHRLV